MDYIYLICSVFCSAASGVFGTYFNRKVAGKKDTSQFYNVLLLGTVAIGWLFLFLTDFSFDIKVLPYSVLFAFFYATCNIALIQALKCGPVSLTSLILSLSLILTTIWGFFFWDSAFTLPVAVGLILVIISLILCIYTKEDSTISPKWLFFVFVAFISNAGCSITQRTQQINFNGQHGKMLMAFATLISLVVCLFIYLRSDKSDSPFILKHAGIFPVVAALCNVGLNMITIILATSKISPSLIYPVIGVGGLAVTLLFSQLAFKEKLRITQWFGILAGAVATVLLSLSDAFEKKD
jgi:drug/metabolite transporter (DMT)-like permease